MLLAAGACRRLAWVKAAPAGLEGQLQDSAQQGKNQGYRKDGV
jgi:hypothetical protein